MKRLNSNNNKKGERRKRPASVDFLILFTNPNLLKLLSKISAPLINAGKMDTQKMSAPAVDAIRRVVSSAQNASMPTQAAAAVSNNGEEGIRTAAEYNQHNGNGAVAKVVSNDMSVSTVREKKKEPMTSGMPAASASASNGSAKKCNGDSVKLQRPIFVGQRVQAIKNGNHCWGRILRKNTQSFTVWFDSGEMVENASGIRTEDEYKQQTATNDTIPSPPPHLRDWTWDANGDVIFDSKLPVIKLPVANASWAPQRLFTEACGRCEHCVRPICETCASCQHNIGSKSAPHVCFRKVRLFLLGSAHLFVRYTNAYKSD